MTQDMTSLDGTGKDGTSQETVGSQDILAVRGVDVQLAGRKILDGVSFQIAPGRVHRV